MDTRVYLNETALSVISIPRTKVWLFAAPVLELLGEQAALCDADSAQPFLASLESDYSDSDNDLEPGHAPDDRTTGKMPAGPACNASLRRVSSQTDNSSKKAQLGSTGNNEANDADSSQSAGPAADSFFHIAYSPSECTVICSYSAFEQHFRRVVAVCMQLGYTDVVDMDTRFFSLQIDAEGQDRGSERILEFTRPLSDAGISLLFLLSHFSDVVLIPQSSQAQVVDILALKDFVYSLIAQSYVLDHTKTRGADTCSNTETRSYSAETRSFSDVETLLWADTGPGALRALQMRTHTLLRAHGIRPRIHHRKKCVLTGGRHGQVQNSIDKASACIARGMVPDYFAITRTAHDEISLLLPRSSRRRARLGFDARTIVGTSLDAIIPITVDLSLLPLNSTGIVAGLAGALLECMRCAPIEEPTLAQRPCLEMNYLSMARSAVVMIPEESLAAVTHMVETGCL